MVRGLSGPLSFFGRIETKTSQAPPLELLLGGSF